MTLHFLNDVANDTESTQKSKLRHKIASLKRETMGKLINRIPGSRLLILTLPGLALRTHVESLGKPRDSTSILKALSGKFDISIDTHLHVIFSISFPRQNDCQT